ENGGSIVTDLNQGYNCAVVAPTAPTKLVNTFGGWYSEVALTTAYTFTTMPANNITLYAKWTVNNYTITFEENGGTEVPDITQAYLSTVTAPTAPTKLGYTFVTWYSDASLITPYTFTTMPANNITLYAKWDYKEYAINYVSAMGDIPSTMIKAYSPIVLVPNPASPGYNFEGWYNDALFIEPFILTVMPEENITIYAKWSATNFTISYETNGGSLIDQIIVPYNQAIPDHGTPVKEGFVFVGWFSDQSLTTPFVTTVMPLGNLTLYAKWIIDDGYDMISTILAQNPVNVKVKGVVYFKFPNPMNPGFYLYDGTGFIFVLAPSTGLSVGDGVELEGNFGYFEFVPQITNVTNLIENTSFTVLPEGIEMSLAELSQSSPDNKYLFGQPIITSGILQANMGRYFLSVAGSESAVAINYKSVDPMNDPFASKIGSKITLRAIIHGVDPMMEIWHILYDPTSAIEEVVLTDQQKVDELIQFGINQLDGKEFYSTQTLELPSEEPTYGAILHFETIGVNASYFNVFTGKFIETDIQKEIIIRITVTINLVTETVDVTIILLPTEILSIAEFLLLQDMDYALVTGIVIFSFEEIELLIIADEDGNILPVQSDGIAFYGDRIIVHGYFYLMEGIVLMSGAENTVVEVIEENVPNPITPISLTISQFNDLDANNPLYWAKYMEVSGELVYDEMSHQFYLDDGEETLNIMIFDYSIHDMLSPFIGFDVVLRGITLPQFDGEPILMFIFSGQPEDISFNYTDQELADLLALMLQGYLESMTFYPGQIVDLPLEHPIINLLVVYSVALEDEHLFDILTYTISSMIEEELWISIFATITINDATAISDIELHVVPIEYLTIAEFLLLTNEDMHYVKGVIVLIIEDQMIMIADETGVLLSVSINPDIQLGDLVILYGGKMTTPDGMIILANNPANTVEAILATGQEHPLTPTPVTIVDFLDIDYLDPQYYLKYYQLEGLLVKEPMSGMFMITEGDLYVPIFAVTPEAISALEVFKGQEVKISGLSLVVSDGGGNLILVFINYPGELSIRYNDEELVAHVATLLSSYYDNTILRPGAIHKLPTTYKPFQVSISYEIIGPNAALYNLSTGLISDTITEITLIGIRATITKGIEVEVVEFDLIVEPIETSTVAEFYAGDFDELYVIRAIVVMSQMFDGPIILADSTGHMFVVKYFDVKVGDEVIIQGYKRDHEGITLIWDEETTILLEIVSENIPNPMTLHPYTIAGINAIDMTDPSNWGLYVEISGYVTIYEDSFFPLLTEFIDGGEFIAFNPMYLFMDGGSQVMMHNPLESIYMYAGYQVVIRGFLFPTFDDEDPYAPDRLIMVTSPYEFELAYETDQDKIDALIEFGTYMLDNNIFRPGEVLMLPEYIPLLGISITWEFVGANGYAIDLATMTLLDVENNELLEFEATITIGELTVTHIFVFNLQPYPIIMIEDFYGLQEWEFGKLQVIVTEIIDYYGVVFGELGSNLYLFGYGFQGLSVGDEVILFGRKVSYDGFVKISGYSDDAYFILLDTAVNNPLIERETTLEELATSDTESMNLLYYHKVQGHLIYDDYMMEYYLTDGLNTIMLFTANQDVFYELGGFINKDVEIKLFNYEFYYTRIGPKWTGLVVEGVDIIQEIIFSDAQILEIMMNYMKNEMNRFYKDNLTYAFSLTHPIYGGTYSLEIDVLDAALATLLENQITFASSIEDYMVTVHITATYNSLDLVGEYDLNVIAYDDPMSTYNPGSMGIIPTIDDTVPIGTFGGFRVTQVDRQLDWFGGASMVVDLDFPYPHEVGANYYTLQYYDFITESWKNLTIYGDPLVSYWNNFSLKLTEGMTLRLITDTGLVSNSDSFAATYID
ncbi:MAG: InlB B-repeat-containing protein, partial [Acholeplasmataceae bacterium]|nr:InlB B-repeat-containing protein [Acholeplasmataceae bacterium]